MAGQNAQNYSGWLVVASGATAKIIEKRLDCKFK